MEAGLTAMRGLVTGAALAADVKANVLWSLDQLPPLYRAFARTYDVRYRDGILGRVRGVLTTLGRDGAAGPRVTADLIQHLHALHDRLNLTGLDIKPPAAPKPARKRKAG